MAKSKFRPRAIIFDMDGVIVDSMPYHYLAWYEALRPYGVRVSCFDVYSHEGERWDKTLREFFGAAGIRAGEKLLKKVFLRRKAIFNKHFKRFIFPRARELLVSFKNSGYILGLVTGTPAAEIKKILPLRIRELFDCVIAGDQVARGKPSPEPYLKASRVLHLPPDSCAVVENAPLGIRSAKKAGMFCVALATSLPKEYLKEADIVVNGLKELPGIFAGV
jgi:beta-phosphoglucomutase